MECKLCNKECNEVNESYKWQGLCAECGDNVPY